MIKKEPDLQTGAWTRPYGLALILILSVLLTTSASLMGSASVTDTIMKGTSSGHSHLISFPEGGGVDASLALIIAGDGPVVDSSLGIGTAGSTPGRVALDIGLDGRIEWAFGGGPFGSFGEQVSFLDGGAHRTLPDSSSNLTFLLPKGASLTDPSMTARSPPSPEGDSPAELIDLGSAVISPEHMDHADLDGASPEDMIIYSASEAEISAVLRDGDATTELTLAGPATNLLALRCFSRSSEGPGGVIYSDMQPLSGFQRVCIATVSLDQTVTWAEIATGLKIGSIGFSIRQDGGAPSIKVIDGQRGTVISVTVDNNGISKHALLGAPGSPSGLSEADIDGDGDLDLVIWPDSGNITLLINTGSDDSPIYERNDAGISGRPVSPTLEIDIDGDGDEEIFAEIGTNEAVHIAVGKGPGDTLKMGYLGLNGTKGSIRSLPRTMYGEGGVYDGGEGLAYIMYNGGIVHILPQSDIWGPYLHRQSSTFSAFTVLASMSEAITVSSTGKVGSANITWTSSSLAALTGANGTGSSLFNPSYGVDLNITALIPSESGPYIEDVYGNHLRTVRMEVSSKDGCFISFRDLSITYSLTFESASSDLFSPALEKARAVFGKDPIPFSIGCSEQGSMLVGPASIVYDSPPSFAESMPDRVNINEGSRSRTVIDLSKFLIDDGIGPILTVRVVMDPDLPEGYLRLISGQLLQAYPELYPDLNGEFDLAFDVKDAHSSVRSKTMVLEVVPVQDGPSPLHEQMDLFMEEGEVKEFNVSSLFTDPEGDPLVFSLDSITAEPYDIDLSADLRNDMLTISSPITNDGGLATIGIKAYDPASGISSRVGITIHLKDIDGPCTIKANPGPIYLSEDQDEMAVGLQGWFVDEDSVLTNYMFTAYPSSRLIETKVAFVGSTPYLFIEPTNDIYGDHYIWVDASNGMDSTYDRLDIVIEPINDPPTLRIEWSEAGTGAWSLRGKVTDPDSEDGRVLFRIGDGEPRTADGWKSFTFEVPYEELNVSGSEISILANDGSDTSGMERIRLTIPLPWGLQFIDSDGDGVTDLFDEFPMDPAESYDTDGDGYGDNSDVFPTNPFEQFDSDGDGYGDNSDTFPDDPTRHQNEAEPPLPGSHRKVGGWIFAAGGAAALLLGLLVFFMFTEIGVVIVATAASTIYSKLSTKDVLNHEIRGLIRGYIIANPGDHYSSIKRNLDLNNGTLAYHLRVLEQNGLVKSMYDGVFKRYYPANVNIAKVKKNVSKQEEIFSIILENPGISMEEIGRLIGVSRQVVNYHVKNLIRSGLISYQRDLKSAKFFPNGNGGNGHEVEI